MGSPDGAHMGVTNGPHMGSPIRGPYGECKWEPDGHHMGFPRASSGVPADSHMGSPDGIREAHGFKPQPTSHTLSAERSQPMETSK